MSKGWYSTSSYNLESWSHTDLNWAKVCFLQRFHTLHWLQGQLRPLTLQVSDCLTSASPYGIVWHRVASWICLQSELPRSHPASKKVDLTWLEDGHSNPSPKEQALRSPWKTTDWDSWDCCSCCSCWPSTELTLFWSPDWNSGAWKHLQHVDMLKSTAHVAMTFRCRGAQGSFLSRP